EPASRPSPSARLAVANTGGLGVHLRAAPGTANRVTSTLAEGSPLVPLGPTTSVNGTTWVQVHDGGGNVGWVDGAYLGKPG
ncbi:MAG TPA: SH3 domain-containing protein, partial [Chloroflexota bacterium]|nr:SH3 domain-containing protein [Chloroflexota bacterium]